MTGVKNPTNQANHNEKRRYEELRKIGYAPKRAIYIAVGEPYGKSRKSMKKWLRENKDRIVNGEIAFLDDESATEAE
jgi:hypothetical protein